ncbi:MAG TPA: molybdenum cofactor guanylyltransferase [Planctomycetaceae bacterium]|nr:molybdenum cofactor guanylyltransferase [Planctomycetaceae bacterium]
MPRNRIAGVVLCGGKSSRMGRPKLSLPFGTETMLTRVVRIVGEVVSPVVVIAGAGQELPDLPSGTLVAEDETPDQGPLGGLAAGLAVLRGRTEAVYLSACDVPLLKPQFVNALIEALGRHELAVPWDGRYFHPLAAVYRLTVEARVNWMIAESRLSIHRLAEECDARRVDVQELRAIDAELVSLRNVNSPHEYREAMRMAGLAANDESATV